MVIPGADPGFQVRGGGRTSKIAPSGGRREICLDISCEKSRFYAKKSYFFQLRREVRKLLGYFVWKITILRQKIICFPILWGARTGCAPPGYEISVTIPVSTFTIDFVFENCFLSAMTPYVDSRDGRSLSIYGSEWKTFTTAIDPNKDISKTRQVHVK